MLMMVAVSPVSPWGLLSLALGLIVGLARPDAASASPCATAGTQQACEALGTGSCAWCAAAVSCVATGTGTAGSVCLDACASVQAAASANVSFAPPPSEFDVVCANGGARAWSPGYPEPNDFPGQRMGGERCVCPSGTGSRGWGGYECAQCTSNATCGSNTNGQTTCNPGWLPTPLAPVRVASCACTSNFCSSVVRAGPDVATLRLSLALSPTGGGSGSGSGIEANVTFSRFVPFPPDRRRVVDPTLSVRASPALIRVRLYNGKALKSVSCNDEACRVGGCVASQVPWSRSSLCDVVVFSNAEVLCPAPPFDFYASVCNNELIAIAFRAPFSVACVVSDSSASSTTTSRACSLSTSVFGHGSLVLGCTTGTCAAGMDPPDASQDAGAARIRENGLLALLFLSPFVVTVAWVFSCLRMDAWLRGELVEEKAAAVGVQAVAASDKGIVVDDDDDTPDILRPEPGGGAALTATFASAGVGAHENDRPEHHAMALRNVGLLLRPSGPPRRLLPWRDRRTDQAEPRAILRHVTTHFSANNLVMVLGASGSGKTSLLDICAGRRSSGVVMGQVVLGGRVASRELLRNRVAYVLQDDAMPRLVTVGEHLAFHAVLRLGTTHSIAERRDAVARVVGELGLASCVDTRLGSSAVRGVSGGERRRVAVAVELLNPHVSLLLCDEPTSGLDSSSSLAVVRALRRVCASRRRGVVATLHQPASRVVSLFDRVVLLTPDGRVAFSGRVPDLGVFLARITPSMGVGFQLTAGTNVAELALDVVSLADAGTLEVVVQSFVSSEFFAAEVACVEEVSVVSATVVAQAGARKQEEGWPLVKAELTRSALALAALGGRNTRQIARDAALPLVHVVATVLVSLCAMVLYFNLQQDLGGAINRAGFMFFLLLFFTMTALADVGAWFEERTTFEREKAAGLYAPLEFAVAKVLGANVPLRLWPVAVCCFITVWGVGLQSNAAAVTVYYFALLGAALVSSVALLAVASLARSQGVATVLVVVFALFSLVLSGFLLIDFGVVVDGGVGGGGGGGDDLLGGLLTASPTPASAASASSSSSASGNIRWIAYVAGVLSYLRYAFEALITNEVSPIVFSIGLRGGSGSAAASTTIPLAGSVILAQLGLSPDNVERDLWLLLAFFAAYVALWAAALTWVVREAR